MLLPAALEARLEWAAAGRGMSVEEFLSEVLARYSAGVDASGIPSREAIHQAAALIEDAGGSAVLPDGYGRAEDGSIARAGRRGG